MKLSDAIVQAHCRKGKADGTTKDGAYWLAINPILIRNFGGDGIGNSDADQTMWLELRHYRDCSTRAVIQYSSRHQNYRERYIYTHANDILDRETVEEIIVSLKSIRIDGCAVYSDSQESELIKALGVIGIPEFEPAPDEVSEVSTHGG